MNFEILVDGESVVKVDLNVSRLSELLSGTVHVPPSAAIHRSSPVSQKDIEELLSRIDQRSVLFLRALASQGGTITWKDMRGIFGIDDKDDWPAYSGSFGKGITRALRNILNDKSARLVWWKDSDWDKAGDDWDSGLCTVYIDGPALDSLRKAFNL